MTPANGQADYSTHTDDPTFLVANGRGADLLAAFKLKKVLHFENIYRFYASSANALIRVTTVVILTCRPQN